METGKRVLIFLSTYNGGKYLREQLDSCIYQTVFRDCSIMVRDDGSSDDTLDILREYEERYGILVFSGNNLGVNGSYQWLFDHADLRYDYYALSDQDDVWFPDKLERAIAKLQHCDENEPALFASCSMLTDSILTPIGSSLKPVKGTSFYNAMLQNVCPGHTQVFNRKLLSMVRGESCEGMIVLDWWLYLLASGAGNVVFSDEFTVKHRQHGGNAIGYGTSFAKLFVPRLKRVLAGESNKMGRQLHQFNASYGQFLKPVYKKELDDFLGCMGSLHARVKYLKRCKVYRQTRLETELFRVLYLMGKYRFKE